VNATQAPVITGNPSNTTKCSNETNATFSVTSVTGTPTPTLQWQVSTDGGNNWSSATGGDYSNDNTTILTVSNLSGKNGYQYRLYATNGINPDAYSSAATLTVTPAATPSVSIVSDDNDNTFCSGTSVTFTATASNLGGGTVSYQWKVNGSNVGSDQNTYTTTTLVNNDAVSCVITITGGCVTTTTATSNTITNTVNTVPAQPSAISGNTTVCAGTSGVGYSVTNVSGVTYAWSYSGTGVTINGSGSSITIDFASNATSGTLTVTPSNDCGNGTAQTLAITVPGAISYSAHPSNASVADGGNTSFSATVSNATSYQWQVSTDNGANWANASGGVYSNETTTTLSITGATEGMNGYQYRLLSSNTCETNIASNAATLTVMASEPTTQAKNIVWAEVGKNYVKIQWTKGNGAKRLVLCKSGLASNLSEVPTDGVTYTANSNYGSGSQIGSAYVVGNTDKDTLTIYGLTNQSTYAFKVIEYNGSGAGTNYQTNGFVTNYNPKHRKIDGKESVSETTSPLVGEHFLLTAISPNPVTSEVNFNIVSKEELPFTIEVYNVRGDLVYSTTAKLAAGDHPFNLKLQSEKGGIPAGTYFLKVTAGDQALQQKFIYQP
ncbi:MAG: T9SS type A sorting domain-containing protein, partial [Candidatus Kapaibacteriota bacterium]